MKTEKTTTESQNSTNAVLGAVPSVVYNEDCVEALKRFIDKNFDLAIVDPPYGLGKRTTDGGSKKNTQTKFMDDIRRSNWDDNVPTAEYWEQLFRVSKNQIVWGGNYMTEFLPPSRCWIFWDKELVTTLMLMGNLLGLHLIKW